MTTPAIAGLPHVVPPEHRSAEGLRSLITQHPNIRFVSLLAVDLAGNETDERIPVPGSAEQARALLAGGVQTDGSSVGLPEIATLNNARVDLFADLNARWYVDYSTDNIDEVTGLPVGTVMIPAFLRHDNEWVDSRSVLQRTEEYVGSRIKMLLLEHPEAAERLGIDPRAIEKVLLTTACELEFWVRTPGARAEVERLAVSQALQEQYWKPTKGAVRVGLERSLTVLRWYGLEPEMGHKEVGGVDARVSGSGTADVMEQIEIDWRYAGPLQTADNELLARTLIDRVFADLGLEVTFQAKPIEGVAGNGEHTHVGIAALMVDGSVRNLFSPREMTEDFLSAIGYGAVMGLLKHWDAVGALVSCSSDAFNRLKPGFEAPVCPVTSLGHSVEMPSRNRSVLAGLVRDIDNPLATRFEVRAPNPHTNTYLATAAIYMAMVNGVESAVMSGRTSAELCQETSKAAGEPAEYLEEARAYRTEEDVFEHFTQEERDRIFGSPPATVADTLQRLESYPGVEKLLCAGRVFTPAILKSYASAMRARWGLELSERLLPANIETVRGCRPLHTPGSDADDDAAWKRVQDLRLALMKRTEAGPSLFARIREAIDRRDDETTSSLQVELGERIAELLALYREYAGGLLDVSEPAAGFVTAHQLLPTGRIVSP